MNRNPDILLDLKDVRYGAAGGRLLDGIDLQVHAEECVAIVGASGMGKSTLLDVVIDPRGYPSQGAVTLDREHTALLTQDGSLLDHLSVIENLRLVQRFGGREGSLEPGALLTSLNIDTPLHRQPVNSLSGGERRRVAIARALMRRPRLLLFDEPDTGLDPGNIRELARAIRELQQQQECGVVVVTHNPWFAALVAQRVSELFAGKLITVSEWPELVDIDNLTAVDARRRELEAHLHQDLERPVAPMRRRPRRSFALAELARAVIPYLTSVLPITRSYGDYLRVFSRTFYIAFITGALFFLLVGGMLGATTIAVVKVLTDNALGGFLKYVLTPKVILKIINGSYIVYLVPAIGAVLFVARSGSIITSWLGVLVLGKQTKALKSLGVDPDRYLRAPVILSLWVAYIGAALVFGVGMWIGSVTTAEYLFDVGNAADLLRFPQSLIWESRLHYKIALYSVFLTFFIAGFGLAPKTSTENVAMHTTKAIIYTTVAISITELLFALDVLLI
jgi:ABC-type lipoprotein export system ATPase subunit/ABC-type transporter Mla maintaining outer membrane lipid asymmetry permease subunit MlaE